jgi:hypothetical protein
MNPGEDHRVVSGTDGDIIILAPGYDGIRISYPDQNERPKEDRFLIPLPPVNLPSDGSGIMKYAPQGTTHSDRLTASHVPDMRLPEDEQRNSFHPFSVPQPPIIALKHDNGTRQLLISTGIPMMDESMLRKFGTSNFRNLGEDLFQKAIANPDAINIVDMLSLLIVRGRPVVLQSQGILFFFPKAKSALPDFPADKIRNEWGLCSTCNQIMGFRHCTVYYKPPAEGTNHLSWLAMATEAIDIKMIPLRQDGMEVYSGRERKLLPLEVWSLHTYTK